MLLVTFDHFVTEVRERFGTGPVYAFGSGSQVKLTAAGKDGVVVCATGPPDARSTLSALGFEIREGLWSSADVLAQEPEPIPWVVAVAYDSAETKPGLWVDARLLQPSAADALKDMYDEFRQSGEMADVSFDEFLRIANPNVVILSPDEIRGFLGRPNCSDEHDVPPADSE